MRTAFCLAGFLLSGLLLAQEPATLSPETLSPETLSPETLSPETLSPETLSPETLSPETLSPETLSPETLSPETLSQALLFHASFDVSPAADFAQGDPQLYTAESLQRSAPRAGLHSEAVVLDADQGKYGGSLSFQRASEKVIFFRGGKNVPYAKTGFAGTVSFWLQLDPRQDLPPDYVDPLQITDKKWDDASLFVDFTKESPRTFRLGVFSDHPFWNPTNQKWEEIPVQQRPLVSVATTPFSRSKWTHVAFTYRNFNAVDGPADAVLYLDGQSQGQLRGPQRFSWTPDRVVILLGINFVGRLDDLAIFNRALTAAQIRQLVALPRGVKSWHPR